MTQQEIKANMTQGTWVSSDTYCIVEINKGSIDLWGIDDDRCMHDAQANAAAIVHAINNTYGKNINPESVPDMYNVLQMVVDELDGCNMSLTAKIIKDILNKATI